MLNITYYTVIGKISLSKIRIGLGGLYVNMKTEVDIHHALVPCLCSA